MKHLLCALAFSALTYSSCTDAPNTAKTDREANRYYALYKRIYRDYGTLPLDSTRAHLEKFLSNYPNDAKAWSFLGRVNYDLGKTDESAAAYRHALDLDSTNASAYAGLGAIMSTLDQNDSAALLLKHAVAQNDSSVYTQMNLALVLAKQNKRDEALEYAAECLALEDSSAEIFAGLAVVFATLADLEQAAYMKQEAIAHGLRDTANFTRVLKGEVRLEDFLRNNR